MSRESAAAPPSPPPSSTSPFASPNAIPPRSSSYGLANLVGKSKANVLRPLSEIDWLSQSSNLKDRRASGSVHPAVATSPPRKENTSTDTVASSNTHITPSNMPSQTMNGAPTPSLNTEAGAQTNGNGVRHNSIYGSHRVWSDEKERILLEPYNYLLGHPGKDIRSQFIAAFNQWLRVPAERLEVITRVIGMLHTASLLYVSLISLYSFRKRPSPRSMTGIRYANPLSPASTTSRTPRSCAAASPSQTASSVSPKQSTLQITSTSRRCKTSRPWATQSSSRSSPTSCLTCTADKAWSCTGVTA